MFRCRNCQVVFTYPMLRQDDTLDRYSPQWFEREYLPSYGIDPHSPSLDHLSARYQAELAPAERFRQSGRLLDVGAGAGLFLYSARAAGWQVSGVEIADFGPRYARQYFGLDIVHGTIQDARFPGDHFDVVMLQDTIEHVTDPRGLLAEAHRVLRPGGAVILSTPNFDSLARRLIGKQWALISPAEHVHLFNKAALVWLLKAAAFQPAWLESDANINPNLVHQRTPLRTTIAQKVLVRAQKQSVRPLLCRYALGDEIHAVGVKAAAT
jgi:2-polyprenyl-3-methyl-5-hydroxy-6-metoxy-1,4-benzoquinol methylase